MYPKSHHTLISKTFIACWILCIAGRVHGAELDKVLLKQFKTEAPLAWKKQAELHKTFFDNTSGVTINSKQQILQGGKIMQNDEYQEKRIRLNYRQMIWRDVLTDNGTVECANPQYAFELTSSTSGAWVITNIHRYQVPSRDGEKKDPYNRIMKLRSEIHPQMLPMQGTLNQIPWMSDEVTIQEIKSVSVGIRECVEVKIEFPFTFYKKNGDSKEMERTVVRRSGVGVFDPANQWVLISFVWLGAPPLKMTYSFTYDENHGGIPFMTSSRRESRNLTTNTVTNEEIYQCSVSVSDLSEVDFTLGAFDFPEPVLEEPPYWLYSSLGGMVLVVIGAVLYKWGVGLRSR